MNGYYQEDRTYQGEDFATGMLPPGTYEQCQFEHCNFMETDLSGYHFIDCTFIGCNLSMVPLQGCVFRDVVFKDCKMLGLRFDTCQSRGLSVSFDHCELHHASFSGTRIRKTIFRHSLLVEADFTDCDVAESIFDECDLSGATFENTNLEKADLRSAFRYTIDPLRNRMKKARFAMPEVLALLQVFSIQIEGYPGR